MSDHSFITVKISKYLLVQSRSTSSRAGLEGLAGLLSLLTAASWLPPPAYTPPSRLRNALIVLLSISSDTSKIL